ncbi:MAG: hypothetical protein ACM3JB_22650 [Acidobacteriaceae bacterium]
MHQLRTITLLLLLSFTTYSKAQQTPPPETQNSNPSQTSQPQITTPASNLADALTQKTLTQSELRDLVRRAMLNDQENYQKQKDLTHVERQVVRHLDKDGKLKNTDSVTREILILYGRRMEHILERDDKPLSPEEQRKEDAKFDKEVAKLQNESPKDRQKRIEKFEEQSRKAREFVTEVANCFNFKFEGEEMVNGRPAYVISGEPRPDYHPKSREGKILSKTRGRIWIDIAATQWVKLDAEFTDTMSFGWFLSRVRPGTRVFVEQHLFRDDVWVPSQIKFNLDARVGLFKQLFQDIDITFRDWRKFSTDAKIIDYSEVK